MKLMICLAVTWWTAPLLAAPQEAETDATSQPELVTATARPLVVYGKLDGVVESPKYAEMELDSNGWSDFEFDYVIPLGVPV